MIKIRALAVGMALIVTGGAFATSASATIVLDQQSDPSLTLAFPDSVGEGFLGGFPAWQSFTAGISGELSEFLLDSNGALLGGSNSVAYEILSGSGTGGAVLGSGTAMFESAGCGSSGEAFPCPLTFDLGSLGIDVAAGQQYTFAMTGISGAGDLVSRGILAWAASAVPDAYTRGTDFDPGYGSSTFASMQFEEFVDTEVPEPASWSLLALGLGVLGYASAQRARKARKARTQ